MAIEIANGGLVVPEKTFNKMWVTHINISSPVLAQDGIGANVTLTPYNDNGESLAERAVSFYIKDIGQKSLDQNSNIAKAMYFLLESIKEEYNAQL
jgi:hypothetical protein